MSCLPNHGTSHVAWAANKQQQVSTTDQAQSTLAPHRPFFFFFLAAPGTMQSGKARKKLGKPQNSSTRYSIIISGCRGTSNLPRSSSPFSRDTHTRSTGHGTSCPLSHVLKREEQKDANWCCHQHGLDGRQKGHIMAVSELANEQLVEEARQRRGEERRGDLGLFYGT